VRRQGFAVATCDIFMRKPLVADSLVYVSGAPRKIVAKPYISPKTTRLFDWYLRRCEEVIDVALDAINTKRASRRLEPHELLTVCMFDTFNPKRIQSTSERPSAMDPAARSLERNARAAIGELQNRATPNRKAIDRLARRYSRRPRQPNHVVRRQRDDLIVAASPARIT